MIATQSNKYYDNYYWEIVKVIDNKFPYHAGGLFMFIQSRLNAAAGRKEAAHLLFLQRTIFSLNPVFQPAWFFIKRIFHYFFSLSPYFTKYISPPRIFFTQSNFSFYSNQMAIAFSPGHQSGWLWKSIQYNWPGLWFFSYSHETWGWGAELKLKKMVEKGIFHFSILWLQDGRRLLIYHFSSLVRGPGSL